MRENKTDYAPIIRKRVREIMYAKGWEPDDLIEHTSLPEGTVDNIVHGRAHDPRLSTMDELSAVLGTSINCIIGKCQHTTEERQLLNLFRSCGNHGRSFLLAAAKYEAWTAKDEREAPDKHLIRCYIPPEHMYQGVDFARCKYEEIYTSKKDAYVAIKMLHNDLAPDFCQDDIILIANRFPAHGEYGVFYMDGRLYIRQYLEEVVHDENGRDKKQYRLRCLHNYAQDMVFKRMDAIQYFGTCIGVALDI